MKNLVKSFDDLPMIVKLILCLPVLNLAYAIYRIAKGADQKNTLILVAGIVWIFLGTTVLWLVDFICTLICKRPTVLA